MAARLESRYYILVHMTWHYYIAITVPPPEVPTKMAYYVNYPPPASEHVPAIPRSTRISGDHRIATQITTLRLSGQECRPGPRPSKLTAAPSRFGEGRRWE